MLTKDIATPRFTLACLQVEHASDTYVAWMNDPETVRYLEVRFHAADTNSLRQYIESVRHSRDSYLFGIFSNGTGTHHGNIKLGPVSTFHRSASIGILIGDKDVWGQGVATEVVAAISSWAFTELGLLKLNAGAYARNIGSIRAFEKCGYSIEGVQRSQIQLEDGSREDTVLLGKVRL